MAKQSKKLLRNKSTKRGKLNNVRLGKKGTRHRKPWKKRTKGGANFEDELPGMDKAWEQTQRELKEAPKAWAQAKAEAQKARAAKKKFSITPSKEKCENSIKTFFNFHFNFGDNNNKTILTELNKYICDTPKKKKKKN